MILRCHCGHELPIRIPMGTPADAPVHHRCDWCGQGFAVRGGPGERFTITLLGPHMGPETLTRVEPDPAPNPLKSLALWGLLRSFAKRDADRLLERYGGRENVERLLEALK